MNNIFFTSDLHFWHKLMIEKKLRPFSSLEEMNETIIENYNSIITDKDDVYILGDIAFGSAEQNYDCLSRLKGRKYLIHGNHDGLNQKIKKLFVWDRDYKIIKLDGKKIVLFHNSIFNWTGKEKGSWHLHGHEHISGNHDSFEHPRKRNVNLEYYDYWPLNYEDLKHFIELQEI